ncbi:MAG: lipopolysaccharide heptosyltransferase I [Epsilonproteobacteria bacterium]|nr:lipopolysaccharide heptosyltransferase I [Campylobacterota bacterium]
MKNDIQRIAIVRLSALGDIVNTAVVLQFIHQHFSHAQIDWITEEAFAPLLRSHPLIHQVHTISLKALKRSKSLSELLKTIKYLRSLGEYDIVIDVQGLIKSAIVARLIGKKTHGFDRDSTRESLASLFYRTASHIAYGENIVMRNTFVVADALGFTITKEMIEHKEAIFKHLIKTKSSHAKKEVAFVIGASWESKKYPKERVAEVVKALDAECHIIWGSEAERQDAEWICQYSHAKIAPKMGLEELVAFISEMDLVIGNDTGPTHMAWAQNIPSITLFGPTNERMIFETPQNIAIKSPSKVNILKIDRNDFSIREIAPQSVIELAKGLL